MIVLDTDIVTLLAYGRHEKLRERVEAAGQEEELAVTVITRMEILQGRFASLVKAASEEELAKASERFRASEEQLDSFLQLGVNSAAGQHFERLRKQRKLNKMGRGDMLNACVAIAHNALLITRNVDDYKAVAGLRVENWAD
jgi:tRNA(fMet)-specific endonuclease VapC